MASAAPSLWKSHTNMISLHCSIDQFCSLAIPIPFLECQRVDLKQTARFNGFLYGTKLNQLNLLWFFIFFCFSYLLKRRCYLLFLWTLFFLVGFHYFLLLEAIFSCLGSFWVLLFHFFLCFPLNQHLCLSCFVTSGC